MFQPSNELVDVISCFKAGKEKVKQRNTVFLFSKIPRNLEEMKLFLPSSINHISHRNKVSQLFSKASQGFTLKFFFKFFNFLALRNLKCVCRI